jgi:hypothetical protein
MIMRLDEYLLRNVFRLRLVAGEADSSGKDHVLIGAHEHRKIGRGAHAQGLVLHWSVIVHAENTGGPGKSQEKP